MPENVENPYAPLSDSDPTGYEPMGQIFHKGKLLVVHKRSLLPDRCVKCNEPTQDRLRRKLSWHNPLVYLLILFNLLIYALVALSVRKTAVFDIPLASRYKSARIRWMVTAWLIFLVSIALLVLGIVVSERGENVFSTFCIIQFPFAFITSLLMGVFGCRVVYASKIDDQYAWIGGTCEEFRQSFPEWPHPGN